MRSACNYRILLTPEPEGDFTVIIPTLPGCIMYGEEAIELYIESLEADGEVIPNEEGVLAYNVTLQRGEAIAAKADSLALRHQFNRLKER